MSDDESICTPIVHDDDLVDCYKLDEDLQLFLNILERRRFVEKWHEEKWEKEMLKHPFYEEQVLESEEMSYFVTGEQKLFNPLNKSKKEIAAYYKDVGGFSFKHMNYRLAVLAYTKSIKIKCFDVTMQASLYNSRGASHFFLRNYRSALIDSERALAYNPKLLKSRLRAVTCSYYIANYKSCIEHSDKYLEVEPSNATVKHMKQASENMLNIKSKKIKIDFKLIKKELKEKKLAAIREINKRGIKFCEDDDEGSKFDIGVPGSDEMMVHSVDGVLFWPILFLYPEVQTSDCVRDCPETSALRDQVAEVFPAPWDDRKRYRVDTVNVYYEGSDKRIHLVDVKLPLKEILTQKFFVLKAGTPLFFILPSGTSVEKSFLKVYA